MTTIDAALGKSRGNDGVREAKMSKHQVLARCNVFSKLASGEIDKIAETAVEREYEAGAIIFHAKEKAEELFILEQGRVALQMISPVPPGRMVTVDVACPGEMVDWSSLIELYVHDLTATCLQGSKVLVLDATRLRSILRDDNTTSKIMKGLVGCLITRLNDTRQLLAAERYWPAKLG